MLVEKDDAHDARGGGLAKSARCRAPHGGVGAQWRKLLGAAQQLAGNKAAVMNRCLWVRTRHPPLKGSNDSVHELTTSGAPSVTCVRIITPQTKFSLWSMEDNNDHTVTARPLGAGLR